MRSGKDESCEGTEAEKKRQLFGADKKRRGNAERKELMRKILLFVWCVQKNKSLSVFSRKKKKNKENKLNETKKNREKQIK